MDRLNCKRRLPQKQHQEARSGRNNNYNNYNIGTHSNNNTKSNNANNNYRNTKDWFNNRNDDNNSINGSKTISEKPERTYPLHGRTKVNAGGNHSTCRLESIESVARRYLEPRLECR